MFAPNYIVVLVADSHSDSLPVAFPCLCFTDSLQLPADVTLEDTESPDFV